MNETVPRILIVDDDLNLLTSMSDILRIKGFDPVAMQTGAEALALIEWQFVDVALIDLRLGDDISGLDVLRAIKLRHPQTECILLTGFASQNSAIQAIQIGAYGYFQKPFDITQVLLSIQRALEKHAVEAALKRSESKYRLLFENANTGIILFDTAGVFQILNEQIARNLGGKPGDFIGKSLAEIFPKQAEFHLRRFSKIIHEKKGATFEDSFPLPDGIRWYSSDIQPVMDSDGSVTGIQILSIDITERKQAEEALMKSEAGYRALSQSAKDAIITIDHSGRIVGWNNSAERTFGYAEKDILGQPLTQILPPNARTSHQNGMMRMRAGGEKSYVGKSVELEGLRKDGRLFPLELSLSEWRVADELFYTGIIRDISERKRAETELLDYRDHLEELVSQRTAELMIAKNQAESANNAKSDFLAMMSHEIRTPLNGILGLTHLALQTELSAKQRDYLTNLQLSSEILMATINDILNFSKIEAGKLVLERVDFSLDNVLHNLAALLAARAQEKDVELVFHTEVNVPRLLTGDPQRLGQVLLNLVANAIKFTTRGEVIVRVRLINPPSGAIYDQPSHIVLEVSVSDTGIGLTEEQISHLFQPFSQADNSTSRKYGGTGLGLTISQRLVRMMGGEIRVQSQPGTGSTFTFTLELEQQPDSDQAIFAAAPDLAGLRVLVVEKHAATQEFLRNTLESFAFHVTTAQSAEQGLLLTLPEDEPFDLVVMDCKLPGGMDGLEAARQIRQAAHLANTRIILLIDKEEMLQKASLEILNGWLVKPITRSQLFDAVMQALGHKALTLSSPTTKNVSEKTRENLRGKHILLVEDNKINQMVAQEILQQMGISVSIASNGEQAVQMAEQGGYDVILMDIQMPGMDGYQASALIRQYTRLHNIRLPIIAMAAYALDGDSQKALDSGLNDYVSKPVNVAQLADVLMRWVDNAPVDSQTVTTAMHQADAERLPAQDLRPAALTSLLDVTGALLRLNNNKKLYQRLLLMFNAENEYAAQSIRSALKNNNMGLARRQAHTLKGLAGTIGADELRTTVTQLESAIADGNHPIYDELLTQVEQKLTVIMASIARLEGI